MAADVYAENHQRDPPEPLQRYRFKRFRNGHEMAEGCSTEAYSLDEALARVKGWYSYADSFVLVPQTETGAEHG